MALSRWQRTIVNETGDIQPFAQITVLNEETQGAAAIYADRDGNSPLANGVATADASGFVYFYTEVGRYRIQSAGLQIDWRDVEIGGGYALLQGGNNADFTAMPKVGGDYIVESGENANGHWTKWADGTMICHKYDLVGTNTGSNRYVGASWTFPQSFTSSNITVIGHTVNKSPHDVGSMYAWGAVYAEGVTTSKCSVVQGIDDGRMSTGDEQLAFNIVAIGRWK